MGNFSYEVFSKVVERGTLAQAAAELNVTPSAVSHSISQLETELGFPLLIRNRTGVTLTEDGAQVLPIIQSIQNLEEQLSQVADNINGVNTGRRLFNGLRSAIHTLKSVSFKGPSTALWRRFD